MKTRSEPVIDRTPSVAAPPRSWQRLARRYPALAEAYDALSGACRASGPLDADEVAVVKLAISVGRGSERTVHAHARKALQHGAHPDALRQVALAALPTIGLPASLDALAWIDESIAEWCAEGAAPPAVR
jgi:alkylhydroperoxidase/carboxymuconolactone decarboxylase family protein YurZ